MGSGEETRARWDVGGGGGEGAGGKCEPGVSSGEAGVEWAVGGGGGVGAEGCGHALAAYSLNT